MEIIFKSEFIMTLDRYLYFCNNPVGEEAERKFRAWKNRNILSFIFSLLCALIFALMKDWVGIYILLFSSAIFLYRLLYQRKKINTNLYNDVRKAQESADQNHNIY